MIIILISMYFMFAISDVSLLLLSIARHFVMHVVFLYVEYM